MDEDRKDFPDVFRFIKAMFAISGTIGTAVNQLEKDMPLLSAAVNLEKQELDLLEEHIEAIKKSNSEVRAMAGKIMETTDFLTDEKHKIRGLATRSQITIALAESSPEFFADVVAVIGPKILDEGVANLPDAEFEKLAAAVEKRKHSK